MPTIHKSAWLCIKDRTVLFLRSHNKDTFYLPGGKREEGETDEEALVREVAEELSVKIEPVSVALAVVINAMAHGKSEPTELVMHCYTANISGDPTPSREIAEMAWWSSADIPQASEAGVKVLTWLYEQDLID